MDQKLFIKAISYLPSPPAVVRNVAETTANPKASASKIEQSLRLDPAISAKVLKLANSAYIGMPHTISSLHHAIVLLGNRRIHSLILGSELLGMIKNRQSVFFPLTRFWRHSVLTAVIAETIAKHLKRYETIDEHIVFSGSILHDIGKLVLDIGLPDYSKVVYQKSCSMKIPFYNAEDQEMSHPVIGNAIAEQWKFPTDLQDLIRYHHEPLKNGGHTKNLAIIHIADIITHVLGHSIFPDEVVPSISDKVLSIIGLPLERLKVIAQTVLKDHKRFEALIEIFK